MSQSGWAAVKGSRARHAIDGRRGVRPASESARRKGTGDRSSNSHCRASRRSRFAACSGGLGSATAPSAARSAAKPDRRARAAQDAASKTRIDIKRLQGAYGYYVDRGLWDQVADLFADDGTHRDRRSTACTWARRACASISTRSAAASKASREGQLNEHMQVMPVVTVAPDGRTAKARWRAIVMAGRARRQRVLGRRTVRERVRQRRRRLEDQKAPLVPEHVRAVRGRLADEPDPTGGKFVSDTLPPDAGRLGRVQDLAGHVSAAVRLSESRRRSIRRAAGGD